MVRFQPANDTTRCGPVFGVRIFTPASVARDGLTHA